MSKWIVLCMCIAMCLVAGAIGAWFTAASVRYWYPTLFKPADTPPSWVSGPVWSTLYVLMGTAARLVWQQRSAAGATVALAFFFDQLLLNATWSFMFFGPQQPGLALIEIVVLLATIIATRTSPSSPGRHFF